MAKVPGVRIRISYREDWTGLIADTLGTTLAMNKPCHEKNALKNNGSPGKAIRAANIGTVGRGQRQPAFHALSLWHKKDLSMLGEADKRPPDCRRGSSHFRRHVL
jgi:hypothetical protein